MTIRVLLADDQQLVRGGFRMILRAEPDLEVVGEAADGAEAVALARELDPDVVLMDVRMPNLDGIEATRRIIDGREQAPRVLVLTTFDLDEYVYEALRAGASGFLLKDAPEDQLVSGIRIVADGGSLFAPAVTRRLIERFAGVGPPQLPPALGELTTRELEVLRLLARGLSNAEIAAELVISEHTAKTHVAHILTKLDLRDRVQAVVLHTSPGSFPSGRGGSAQVLIPVFRARPKAGHASVRKRSSPRWSYPTSEATGGGSMCVPPLALSTRERSVQVKRLLTPLALAAAALALAATASAADHTTVTETNHIHGAFTEPEFDANPCTGAAITSLDGYGDVVAHVTYFHEEGGPTEVWATFTETRKLTLTEANNVTYTGHFTAWGNFNLNERNTNNTSTLTLRASGSDGSSLTAHETEHFALNANGQITVSFDRLSLDCG